MTKNELEQRLLDLIKENGVIELHDEGNYPILEPEDSELRISNGKLVWERFIGSDMNESWTWDELTSDDLDNLVDWLYESEEIDFNHEALTVKL